MSRAQALRVMANEAAKNVDHPEVTYEIMLVMASDAVANGQHASADAILRSAATLPPMFGGHGAERAWREQRAELPLWKRWLSPSEPPRAWRAIWSEQQRERGRRLVAAALRGA